ncbi:ribulose-phosphate 3-epimerase [Anaerobium acetethylicum]|uniref:Ribulose-phosphate 3-epimerase n=1 Tax=Anaerobium acetethylicum TaxID=1619234 RepID=A0A1D3TWI4_9FIRM|nr:ribulose-phosphate 3-epimerase [Anaerobium acetethylicum]SCP98621.1 ribulose-phosphate 3-epimerase [Anaerobium acetethylicum]
MNKIAPSLLEADFKCLQRQLEQMESAGAHYIHIDVMDGNFVPNLSFGFAMLKSIRTDTNLVFDVHLMIKEPIRFVDRFKEAGADIISVHYEACEDVKETIDYIKHIGLKAGIAINPFTSLDALDDEILKKADVIHLMTVKPGIAGQKFIETSIDKIRNLKKRLESLNIERDIEVDGDINVRNLADVLAAGANVIVSGKALFQGDIRSNINEFNAIIEKVQEDASCRI